jgi:hypothetical protein
VDEVTDEPLYRDRVCGIDIGKAQMVATIRVPSDRDPARRAAETRTFATTKRGVLALAWQGGSPVSTGPQAAVQQATARRLLDRARQAGDIDQCPGPLDRLADTAGSFRL